jgi:hypothetical protein
VRSCCAMAGMVFSDGNAMEHDNRLGGS